MLEKLLGYALSIQAGGHKVMPPVSKHTDKFRGQRFIQHFDHGGPVCAVSRRHRPTFDISEGPFAQSLAVG
jgi:hypothetical protein